MTDRENQHQENPLGELAHAAQTEHQDATGQAQTPLSVRLGNTLLSTDQMSALRDIVAIAESPIADDDLIKRMWTRSLPDVEFSQDLLQQVQSNLAPRRLDFRGDREQKSASPPPPPVTQVFHLVQEKDKLDHEDPDIGRSLMDAVQTIVIETAANGRSLNKLRQAIRGSNRFSRGTTTALLDALNAESWSAGLKNLPSVIAEGRDPCKTWKTRMIGLRPRTRESIPGFARRIRKYASDWSTLREWSGTKPAHCTVKELEEEAFTKAMHADPDLARALPMSAPGDSDILVWAQRLSQVAESMPESSTSSSSTTSTTATTSTTSTTSTPSTTASTSNAAQRAADAMQVMMARARMREAIEKAAQDSIDLSELQSLTAEEKLQVMQLRDDRRTQELMAFRQAPRQKCRNFSRGVCSRGDTCAFSHAVCRFWTKGHCVKGDNCDFGHPPQPLDSERSPKRQRLGQQGPTTPYSNNTGYQRPYRGATQTQGYQNTRYGNPGAQNRPQGSVRTPGGQNQPQGSTRTPGYRGNTQGTARGTSSGACVNFARAGRCRMGTECRYSHDREAIARIGDELCLQWVQGSCKFDDQCLRSHDAAKLRSTGSRQQ